jgi:hypothetical protein
MAPLLLFTRQNDFEFSRYNTHFFFSGDSAFLTLQDAAPFFFLGDSAFLTLHDTTPFLHEKLLSIFYNAKSD